MLKPLTKKEKINCRAYDKMYIETQSFIRTRFLNGNTNSTNKTIKIKETIKNAIDCITNECINNFFKPYI